MALAGFPSRLEPSGFTRKDGKRPDGLALHPYKQGKCLVMDATCVDTMAVSYIGQTSTTPGKVAENADLKKVDLYQELQSEYLCVLPAVETMGT